MSIEDLPRKQRRIQERAHNELNKQLNRYVAGYLLFIKDERDIERQKEKLVSMNMYWIMWAHDNHFIHEQCDHLFVEKVTEFIKALNNPPNATTANKRDSSVEPNTI